MFNLTNFSLLLPFFTPYNCWLHVLQWTDSSFIILHSISCVPNTTLAVTLNSPLALLWTSLLVVLDVLFLPCLPRSQVFQQETARHCSIISLKHTLPDHCILPHSSVVCFPRNNLKKSSNWDSAPPKRFLFASFPIAYAFQLKLHTLIVSILLFSRDMMLIISSYHSTFHFSFLVYFAYHYHLLCEFALQCTLCHYPLTTQT